METIAENSAATYKRLILQKAVDQVAKGLTCQQLDRRRSPRYPFQLPISLHQKDADGFLSYLGLARGLDISCLGLAFLTRTKLAPRTEVYVNLDPLIGRVFYLKLAVVHCSDEVDGMFRVGGQFIFDEEPIEARDR